MLLISRWSLCRISTFKSYFFIATFKIPYEEIIEISTDILVLYHYTRKYFPTCLSFIHYNEIYDLTNMRAAVLRMRTSSDTLGADLVYLEGLRITV